ncbi:DUF1540 domain-containing protein [Paenibacillus xanthanilyticus]|uniref:DUF1540 domain-containing protein n=1 Tax=Paenibacillus xanthanilyticus TaxID=1783531 RepID=A0ABV8KD47_9BACL
MPNGVSCSVSNCSFWGQGNQCNAKEIHVEIDRHAHSDFGAEMAEEGFLHQDKAQESATTCCHTFKPKGE